MVSEAGEVILVTQVTNAGELFAPESVYKGMKSTGSGRNNIDGWAPEAHPRTAHLPPARPRGKVVVIDSGSSAVVVVFAEAESLERGSRFDHRGTTWVICERQRDSGILVAEPAAPASSV